MITGSQRKSHKKHTTVSPLPGSTAGETLDGRIKRCVLCGHPAILHERINGCRKPVVGEVRGVQYVSLCGCGGAK